MQSELDKFRIEVMLHAPAFAQLLDKLDTGVQPDPIEVMLAISDCVAWLTGDASIDSFSEGLRCGMHAGYCPTC